MVNLRTKPEQVLGEDTGDGEVGNRDWQKREGRRVLYKMMMQSLQ